MLHHPLGVLQIGLFPVGHQHTEYPLRAQRFAQKLCRNCGILTSGNTDHGSRCRPVCIEPRTDPFNDMLRMLFCIEFFHGFLSPVTI